MLYGLPQKTIQKTNGVFSEYIEIDEAILYGSRAKGNHTSGSDIDLTLKGKKLSLFLLNAICNDLDDLLLPYTFDLSIYDHISNPDLIEHIKRVGLSFYKKA